MAQPISGVLISRNPDPFIQERDASKLKNLVDEALNSGRPEWGKFITFQACRRELTLEDTMQYCEVLVKANILSNVSVKNVLLYQALRFGDVEGCTSFLPLFDTPSNKEAFIVFVLEQSQELGLEGAVLVNLCRLNFFVDFSPNQTFLIKAISYFLKNQIFDSLADLVKNKNHDSNKLEQIDELLTKHAERTIEISQLLEYLNFRYLEDLFAQNPLPVADLNPPVAIQETPCVSPQIETPIERTEPVQKQSARRVRWDEFMKAFRGLDITQPDVRQKYSQLSSTTDFANISYRGTSLLHVLIIEKRNFWIKFLANPFNVHLKDSLGRTPLHLAVMFKNIEACFHISKQGADWFAQDYQGLDIIDYAFKYQFPDIVSLRLADCRRVIDIICKSLKEKKPLESCFEAIARCKMKNPLKVSFLLNNKTLFARIASSMDERVYLDYLTKAKNEIPGLTWKTLMNFVAVVNPAHLSFFDPSNSFLKMLETYRESILSEITRKIPVLYNTVLEDARNSFGLPGALPIHDVSKYEGKVLDNLWNRSYRYMTMALYSPEKMIQIYLESQGETIGEDFNPESLLQALTWLISHGFLTERVHPGSLQKIFDHIGRQPTVLKRTDEESSVDIVGEKNDLDFKPTHRAKKGRIPEESSSNESESSDFKPTRRSKKVRAPKKPRDESESSCDSEPYCDSDSDYKPRPSKRERIPKESSSNDS